MGRVKVLEQKHCCAQSVCSMENMETWRAAMQRSLSKPTRKATVEMGRLQHGIQ